ncbi:hypothetical protein AMATHDRAFT_143203 [Amanita thiersii Skay4041]|uniref:DNA helicase n=1 Tax=Amanita thiersii Skay4041 TaxID=703135 RepID=A0A2A9NJG1_9AGAR|nr:hypothetical protein AMATHDRAFT_143203 [Amanita thiersii Skay4041]
MVTEDQVKDFLTRQRLLLKRERDAEVSRSSLLLSNCGPKLLEQKGLSLGGLGVVSVNIGLGGKTLVELERPTAYHNTPLFPPHSFRPGDLARIEPHVSSNAPQKKAKKSTTRTTEMKGGQTEGVVYKVSDIRIVIAIDQSDSSTEDLDLSERCRVVKLANSITYDRMDDAIDQLEKRLNGQDTNTTSEQMRLTQVLLGVIFPSARVPINDLQFLDPSLNSSQKEAVRFALESPELACIHGPPGTGKTHTLIEIIRQLTSASSSNPKPLRLLVCGASNLSVDNILERLLALPTSIKAERIKVTRIGHPARVMAQENILESTLEVQAAKTDQASLAKDVKNELEETLAILSGKGKGAKGKKPRGVERKKLWDDVKALRKEYRQREGGVVKSVLSEAQVVLATCHSAGGRQLRNLEFDVAIIDEATQALEAVCWVPMFKVKKLILAGDPMQLPPTILSLDDHRKDKKQAITIESKENEAEEKDGSLSPQSTTDAEAVESDAETKANPDNDQKSPVLRPPRTLETTLFDRLEKMYGPSVKRMLEIQYRMHEHICSFPSKTLYSSRLKPAESVAKHLLTDLPNIKNPRNTRVKLDEEESKEILGTPVVFFDTSGCEYFERTDAEGNGDEGSKCNENEALVVKNWVEQLIDAGIEPSQIAIITPYQAQVTLLTSILRPKYGPSLEIGTVDGMQGREKDAIVISLVRSNELREVGFLKEKRRMNVAMTRAKRHLCIVGDSSTVRHGSRYLKSWIAWLEAHADVRYAGLE